MAPPNLSQISKFLRKMMKITFVIHISPERYVFFRAVLFTYCLYHQNGNKISNFRNFEIESDDRGLPKDSSKC